MSERSAREPGSPRPTSEAGSAGDGRPAAPPTAAHAAPDGKAQGGTQDLAQSLRAAATRATQAASAAAARVTSSGATTRPAANASRDAGQSAFGARPRLPLPPPPEAPLPRRAGSTPSATGPTVPTPAPTATVPTRAPEATVPNPPSSPTALARTAASADGRADVDDDRRWATAAPQDRPTAAAPTGNPNFARPQDSLVDGDRPVVAAMPPINPTPAGAATPTAPASPAATPAPSPSPRPAEEVHGGTGGTAAAAAGLAGGGVAGGAAATQLAPPPVRPSSPSTGAERTADPAARTASPVEAARAAGTGQPSRATTAPGPATQRHPTRIRKARLRLLRVDPWSVMKTAFLLSIAAGAMLVVAIGVLWSVLDAAGVFSQVGNVVRDVTSSESSPGFSVEEYLGFSRVMGFSTLIAVIDIVLVTALATLGAFLYNLSASLLGGLEVTLAEDD